MSYKRSSPLTIFILVYVCIIIPFIFFERSVSENIIESNGIIATIGFILTLLEFPKIFSTVWKKFLERMIDDKLDGDGEKMICSIVSIIALLLVFTYINMIIIEGMNKVLDFSKPVKRNLTVTNKIITRYYNSKRHKTTYSYSIYISSWVSHNSFSIVVSEYEYNKYHIGDVLETTTKSGFFGFPYYDKLKKLDRNIFPVRPNEHLSNKQIEEKKGLDSERRKIRIKLN